MPESKEAIRTCRCIVKVLPVMLGWVVGEGGRAMRSSLSEMDVRGARAIDTHHIPFWEVPGASGGWFGQ